MMQQPPTPQKMVAVSERHTLSSLSSLACPMVYARITDAGMLPSYALPMDNLQEKAVPLLQPLELSKLSLGIECHISTAFVTIYGTWSLNQNIIQRCDRCDCLLLVPTPNQATVAGVQIDLGGDRIYGTLVVPQEETGKYATQGAGPGAIGGAGFSPEVFRLIIPQVKVGSSLDIRVSYFQAMEFDQRNGRYAVRVPLTLHPSMLAGRPDPSTVLSLTCSINTGVELPVETGPFSHPMQELASSPGHASFAGDLGKGEWRNVDFVASYKVWAEGILPALIMQGPIPYSYDQRGAFCLSISPPDPKHVQAFQRAVVFVLDRSGSMSGTPMASACAALVEALWLLRANDRFTIIAFDHEQLAFSTVLLEANSATVKRAVEWVGQIRARGLTDILTPLMQAVQLVSAAEGAVPYVFLITDGAVDNERMICAELEQVVRISGPRAPRVSTFGIGQYCNFFFLKMLASIGRGLNDVAFTERRIKAQMERMLVAASTPLLTNITLGIKDLPHGCEVYPFPIPDLFCGNPLTISGKFDGRFPDKITVLGTLPDQSLWSVDVVTRFAPNIPIHTVFAKQQLDLLTARAWLTEDDKVKQQAVQLSVATGVPCEYTRMVAFETTKPQYQEALQNAQQGKKLKLAKYAVGGLAGVIVVAGLAVGFGSVAATVGNLGIGVPDLSFIEAVPDLGWCGDCSCGDCDCGGCGDCGDCSCDGLDCDGFGDCIGGLLDGIGSAF